jgi:hypothetical protein
MPATLTKACRSCREQHLLFLAIGNTAELTKRYEYICPRSRLRVLFEPAKQDAWKRVDSKIPGSVIVREAAARV